MPDHSTRAGIETEFVAFFVVVKLFSMTSGDAHTVKAGWPNANIMSEYKQYCSKVWGAVGIF